MPQNSFLSDIKPLFRAVDISHMKRFGVELDRYTYMSIPDNGNRVLARSRRRMAGPLRCQRYSCNGRTADTCRELLNSAGVTTRPLDGIAVVVG